MPAGTCCTCCTGTCRPHRCAVRRVELARQRRHGGHARRRAKVAQLDAAPALVQHNVGALDACEQLGAGSSAEPSGRGGECRWRAGAADRPRSAPCTAAPPPRAARRTCAAASARIRRPCAPARRETGVRGTGCHHEDVKVVMVADGAVVADDVGMGAQVAHQLNLSRDGSQHALLLPRRVVHTRHLRPVNARDMLPRHVPA